MDDPQMPSTADPPREDATGTRYTCPDCGGVLFEQEEGALTRFRCSVGHVFSIESLAAGQAHELEGALWTAVRALEDRAELVRQLSARCRREGQLHSAQTFAAQAEDAERRAGLVRDAIEHARAPVPPPGEAQAVS